MTTIEQLERDVRRIKKWICCTDFSSGSGGKMFLSVQNYNNDTDLDYPLGVFSTTGTYLGIATTADEYIALWNADTDNQQLGQIESGSGTDFVFAPIYINSIVTLYGLEYFSVTGTANLKIHGSDGMIAVYGSTPTIIDFSTSGTPTSSDTEFEWYGNGTSGRYRHAPVFTFKKVTLTGLTNNSTVKIFHSRDCETFGAEFSNGAYDISGILPRGLKNFFYVGQNITDFNQITNWADLDQLEWFFLDHAGGGAWRVEAANLPTAINTTSLKGVCTGEYTSVSGYLTWMDTYIAPATGIRQVEYYSNGGTNLVSNAATVTSLPVFTELLTIRHASTATASAADVDAFLIALDTLLTGVTPIGQKTIRMNACTARTATSDTAYNNLTGAGWTITIT